MSSKQIAVLVKRFPKLSETFILGEIRSLVEKGFDVRIISLHKPNEILLQPDSATLQPRVTYLEDYSRSASIIILLARMIIRPLAVASVLRAILSESITVTQLARLVADCRRFSTMRLHVHYISEPTCLANLATRLCGGSYSVSAHAKDIYLTDESAIKSRIARASFVVTCTAHNVAHLRQAAPEFSRKIFLSYHGIDTKFFSPRAESGHPGAPLVLSIGRFKSKKGFDLLIAACAELKNRDVPFRCEIVGYGDQKDVLSRMIAEHELEELVVLKAPVDHSQLVGLLRNADLFVLPCRQMSDGDRDGIPNAMLEAMACGVPVVSTAISGIPEVIQNGSNGVLVEPENPHLLADAMARVLNDKLFGAELARSGRLTVTEKFDWDRNIATLARLLLPARRKAPSTSV